jgi:peptide chain release factor 1
MFDKLESVVARFQEVEARLADPQLAEVPGEFRKLSQEHAQLQELVAEYRHLKKLQADIASSRELLGGKDAEMSALAKDELKALEPALVESEQRLRVLLLPKDANDEKNIVLEVRAGAGGDEAALFAGELFRMYQRFAERTGWRVDLLSTTPTGLHAM